MKGFPGQRDDPRRITPISTGAEPGGAQALTGVLGATSESSDPEPLDPVDDSEMANGEAGLFAPDESEVDEYFGIQLLEEDDALYGCGTYCPECGKADFTGNHLVCDNCDRPFHIKCMVPQMKSKIYENIIADEDSMWYCHECALQFRVCHKCRKAVPGEQYQKTRQCTECEEFFHVQPGVCTTKFSKNGNFSIPSKKVL